MARLPWLFQTHSGVPKKKNLIAAVIIVFVIILCEFRVYKMEFLPSKTIPKI